MPKVRNRQDMHRWSFFRAGGVDQVLLRNGEDIRELKNLNQKLWVALSCPTVGLQFDQQTLAFLDEDGDGRVRAPEILAAISWLESVLKSLDGIVQEKAEVPLASLRTDTKAGRALAGAVSHMLAQLGKAEAKSITLEDALETKRVLTEARQNGDGIVPPGVVEDVILHKVAADLVASVGGKEDRSGLQGFDAEKIDEFFHALEEYSAWMAEGEANANQVWPLGEKTDEAYDALRAVRAKIDDWFTRGRLAAFDPRAQSLMNAQEHSFLSAAAMELTIDSEEIKKFPLSAVAPNQALPIAVGINPAYEAAMEAFRESVLVPLLGGTRTSLTEAEWKELKARFTAFEGWKAAERGQAVAALGLVRVRKILASEARADLMRLVAEDLSVEAEFSAMQNVEKLVRFHRYLFQLLNNYVSFGDFYSRKRPAIFQAGTLYLDARSCDLCVRVDDAGKHAPLGILAKTYIAYCDLKRPNGEKMTVACAFTSGDSDHLMVGRNGIFYDLEGNDWDATITSLLENPIGIRQAFWAPYKRLMRWIEQQIVKRAAEADSKANDKLVAGATAAGDAATQGAAAAPKPKFDVGVVAALGVAVGGITAAVGAILNSLFGLGKWMPIGLVGVIFIISGPSMLIAWMKLRQRNLGPILDANGWAINGRMKVNIPLGGSLTEVAKLPAGAERLLRDPFAEKKPWWPRILFVLVLLLGAAYGLSQWESAPGWSHPVRDAIRQVVPFDQSPAKEPTKEEPKSEPK